MQAEHIDLTIKVLTALISADEAVIQNTPNRPSEPDNRYNVDYGICNNLHFEGSTKFLRECFKSWEHYSGDDTYPVPDPDNMGCPEAAYRIYHTVHESMYSGPYGELRRDLAQHILNKLNELKENAGERKEDKAP